jgi:hypothetical protein
VFKLLAESLALGMLLPLGGFGVINFAFGIILTGIFWKFILSLYIFDFVKISFMIFRSFPGIWGSDWVLLDFKKLLVLDPLNFEMFKTPGDLIISFFEIFTLL